jgi:hypothetical protein
MTQIELAAKPEMLTLDAKAIDAQPTLTSAIMLCQQLGGVDDKKLYGANAIVKNQSQWSRVKGGQHFFPQDKLIVYMDICHNEAPLFWLARRRGYNLVAMETELDRQLRIERQARQKAEERLEYLEKFFQGKR